jgi:hypothetical protein
MARWERDPRLRKRLAWVLALIECVAVSTNFAFLFWGVAYSFAPRLGLSLSPSAQIIVAAVAGVVCLGVTLFEAVNYVKGCRWCRVAFIVQNLLLIAAGIAWFIVTHRSGSNIAGYAAGLGLLLPMMTLFPLLWPLKSFNPSPPPAPPGQDFQY